MAQLIVRLKGAVIQTLELNPLHDYIGGRGEGCQIQLTSEKGISRQHFKLAFKSDHWELSSLSKIGEIFIASESKKEFKLETGVIFSVPPYEFQYLDENQKTSSPSLVNPPSTVSLHPKSDHGSTQDDMPEEKTLTVAHTSNMRAVVNMIDDNGDISESHDITADITYVGRDNDNQIILDHPKVSRRQFKISKVSDKYFLQDLESSNGTFINGNKVNPKQPSVLLSGDIITVLNIKMSFEMTDPNFKLKVIQAENQLPLAPQVPIQFAPPVPPAGPYNPQSQIAPYDPHFPASNMQYGQLQIGESPHGNAQDGQQFVFPGATPITGAEPVPELNFWGRKIPLTKQNKIRLGMVGVILLLLIIFGSSDDSNIESESAATAKVEDPFTKLTPEEQNYVRHTYSLAKNLYMQANYLMAQTELMKVHEKVPKFEDSKELENYIKLALEAQKQQEENERIEKEKKELEERVQNIIKHCSQLISKNMTVAQLNECLAPAIEINPEHPGVFSLRESVLKIEEERQLKEQEKAKYESQVKELKDQFLKAMKLSELDPIKGVVALDEVMTSTLPDPDKLRDKARKQKNYIQNDTKKKINEAISKSAALTESGNYKEAIMLLDRARLLDPEDESIPQNIELTIGELRKKMQVFYQEAVVEENIGNVETAKEKWRKIMELDVPNGEYYQKSKLKLKKYGAL